MTQRSAEYERLLRVAVAQKEAEDRKLAAMTPTQRHEYIRKWAARVAPRFAADATELDRELNATEKP